MSAAAPAEAVIVGAAIAAGHDGAAELVVSLRYGNGGVGQVTLDAALGFSLLQTCGVESIDQLTGQPWRRILEGLP